MMAESPTKRPPTLTTHELEANANRLFSLTQYISRYCLSGAFDNWDELGKKAKGESIFQKNVLKRMTLKPF